MTRKVAEPENLEEPVNEETAVAVRDSSAVTPYDPQRQGAIFALGTMSDAEFAHHVDVLKAGVERIRQLQRSLLTKGSDFDTLDGTGDRVVLLKPGAEKLAAFASLVPVFRHHLDIATFPDHPDRITYTVECDLHYGSADGPMVGSGVGVCSSWEKKYRWRDSKPVCPTCGKETINKSKHEPGYYCWKKIGGCGATFGVNDQRVTSQPTGRTENEEPYEQINTFAKMGEKRAHVDATIRTLNASSLFTQDIGDDEPSEDGPEPPDRGSGATQSRARPPARNRAASNRPQPVEEPPPLFEEFPATAATFVAPKPDGGVLEGTYSEVFDDQPQRAEGERGKVLTSTQGTVQSLTRELTPGGNPFWHLTLLGDDLKLYECAVAMDTAIETGVVGGPDETESPYNDGRTVAISGTWTLRGSLGMWVHVTGLVA